MQDCTLSALGANHNLVIEPYGRPQGNLALDGVVQVLAGWRPDRPALPLPDLTVAITGQRAEGARAARFTVVVRNIGGRAVLGVVVRDRISGTDGAATVSAQGLRCPVSGGPIITCKGGNLGVYQEATVNVVVPFGLTGAPLRNMAMVDPNNALAELDEGNKSASSAGVAAAAAMGDCCVHRGFSWAGTSHRDMTICRATAVAGRVPQCQGANGHAVRAGQRGLCVVPSR